MDVEARDKLYKCDCGEVHRAVPYEGRHVGHPDAPDWCAPRLNPCSCCKPPPPEEVLEAEVRRRLHGANVPEGLWRFALTPERWMAQHPTESDETFLARVRRDEQHRMGMARANRDAFGIIARWHRELRRGEHRRWLILHGPPGTGKTALLAAIARSLLTSEPDKRVELGEHELPNMADDRARQYARIRGLTTRIKRGRPPPETWYCKPSDLGRQEGESWEADSGMQAHAKRVRLLLLDELGVEAEPQKWELRAVEALLSEREERHRITVMSTNRQPSELRTLYGLRVGSRLDEALTVPIGGPSWRTQ